MSSNKEPKFNKDLGGKSEDVEFDFVQIFSFLNRNKNEITKFGIVGLILAGIFAFTSKKVWKGEFQIVLELGGEISDLKSQSPLNFSFGFGRQFDPLVTEVKILESPSVLMNIFQYVKDEKAAKVDNLDKKAKIQKKRFKDWKKENLKIELTENTSILNLSYKDTDKELIIPVLNKISSAYQNYSGKKRKRNLELGAKFAKEQIKEYTKKTSESLRKSQQFAMDNDLTLITSLSETETELRSGNIEEKRVKSANEIRIINKKLEQLESFDKNSDEVIFYASTIPAMQDLYKSFKNIDEKLAELRVIYKDSDEIIRDLLEERKILLELVTKRTKGILLAQRTAAEAILESSKRPKGIIIQYRQLLNDSIRDQATLTRLEKQYIKIQLEQAKLKDPWELVTIPTLYPLPVEPKILNLMAAGIFAGIFIGTLARFISEKRKNLIISTKDIQSITNFPIKCIIDPKDTKNPNQSLEIFLTSPLLLENTKIAFLKIGKIDNESAKELQKVISRTLSSKNFIISGNLLEIKDYPCVVLIIELNVTSKEELIYVKDNLSLQQKLPLGCITLINQA